MEKTKEQLIALFHSLEKIDDELAKTEKYKNILDRPIGDFHRILSQEFNVDPFYYEQCDDCGGYFHEYDMEVDKCYSCRYHSAQESEAIRATEKSLNRHR